MSERYQKTFISAREFVDSWEKEIYELTNLDYFIYILINYLGNQIENRYFIEERLDSPLFLDFDSIGTLCFNLGDALSYYLENKHQSSQPSSNTNNFLLSQQEEDTPRDRLNKLQSFAEWELDHEHTLRIELMEHVILDTLLHFYYEELGLEVEEGERELNELAFFIEDAMVDFTRREGATLLARPIDPAMDYFEELLENEEEGNYSLGWFDDFDWDDEDETTFQFETAPVDIASVVNRFLEECDCSPETLEELERGVELFSEYLIEEVGAEDIYELSNEHFLEFLSVWLVQRYVYEDESQLPGVFHFLARFVTWLYHNYSIDYKRAFLNYYDRVKTEVPRVVKALKLYLNECNLFEILLQRGNPETTQITGFFEILELSDKYERRLDVVDVHGLKTIRNAKFDFSAYSHLQRGDFLQATLIYNENGWEVLEIQYIYPKVSKRFVY